METVKNLREFLTKFFTKDEAPPTRNTGFAEMLRLCEPGSSFEIQNGRTGAYVTAKRLGIKIVVRQVKGKPGWIKVWRVDKTKN